MDIKDTTIMRKVALGMSALVGFIVAEKIYDISMKSMLSEGTDDDILLMEDTGA